MAAARPLERYYRPNFPVVLAADRAALQPALDELADAFAAAFRDGQAALGGGLPAHQPARPRRSASRRCSTTCTPPPPAWRGSGWRPTAILPPWPEHDDGSRWVWWAEEPPETEVG